jgi:cyclopropane fatty-acyl-phospholipid synthase-like methyltransferase
MSWNSKSYDWVLRENGEHHSPAFDRNGSVLFQCLMKEDVFCQRVELEANERSAPSEHMTSVLEIGSGTGEHMRFWAQSLPKVKFFPSEISPLGREAIQANCKNVSNIVLPPLSIDLLDTASTFAPEVDVVIAVYLFHVVPISAIERFAALCEHAKVVAVYGAFARHGQFTSSGNKQFHKMVSKANSDFGLRDVENEMIPTFAKHGLMIEKILEMPEENFLIIWRRRE